MSDCRPLRGLGLACQNHLAKDWYSENPAMTSLEPAGQMPRRSHPNEYWNCPMLPLKPVVEPG